MRTLVIATLAVVALGTAGQATAGPFKKDPKKQEAKRDETRQQIDTMAANSLERLFREKPETKELYERAYGYAVFDSTKFALGLSGGGGHGEAVRKSDGVKTYMRMGTVGVGLGLGGQNSQIVFFFETETVFNRFVNEGWEADASASATAGNEGAIAETDFRNGMAYYQFSDKGLMLRADIAGTKYWKADKLND